MRGALDDIFPIMEWLEAHPDIARSIAANGQAFACRHLRKEARHKHWRTVFGATAAQLDYAPDPSRRQHMIHVRWGAVYKLRIKLTRSLKAPGFNP
jgi:hypothetical protein